MIKFCGYFLKRWNSQIVGQGVASAVWSQRTVGAGVAAKPRIGHRNNDKMVMMEGKGNFQIKKQ